MKNYNKLPFKERKRHWEYSERHEEILIEKETERMIKSKCREKSQQDYPSEKEREALEANEIFKRMKEQI